MAGEFELKKKALKRDAGTSSADKPDTAGAQPVNRPPVSPPANRKPAQKINAGGKSMVEQEKREADAEASLPGSAGKKQKTGILSRTTLVYSSIALATVALGFSIIFLLSLNTIKEYFEPAPPPKLEPVTSITRPIPVPDYREMLDFLILNETEGQKTLTLFRMEIACHSPTRYKNFKEQNVVFRDAVYSFLLKQNSSRITSRSWYNIVEKELLDYIRVKLPQSHADAIKLTQVENL